MPSTASCSANADDPIELLLYALLLLYGQRPMPVVVGYVMRGRKKQKSRLFVLLLPECLQFPVPLCLLLGLLDEVSDGVAL